MARVQACVPGLEEENCKVYPFGNSKPIGLLQTYGDDNQLWFGMMAGTYGKSRSGGDLVTQVIGGGGENTMCREINLGRDCDDDGSVDDLVDATHAAGDGTFKKMYDSAGGPESNATKSEGIINAWSLYRIYGYDYDNWNYVASSPGDKCYAATEFFGDVSDSECHNWGNPFSEIYLNTLRYLGGLNQPGDFQSGEGQYIEGANYVSGVWDPPTDEDNYCSKLYVVNFNSSVSTTDADELDEAARGIIPDLGSALTSKQYTDIIGAAEESMASSGLSVRMVLTTTGSAPPRRLPAWAMYWASVLKGLGWRAVTVSPGWLTSPTSTISGRKKWPVVRIIPKALRVFKKSIHFRSRWLPVRR